MKNQLSPKSVSTTGVNLVKKFEGLHKKMADGRIRSYRDPAGIWTIGYGHTKGVRSGQHITEEEANRFLIEDLEIAKRGVLRLVKVPLTQNQLDALVSWTFNLGEGNLSSSTMLKRLNAGRYDQVPSEMTKWHKARVNGVLTSLPGLVRRRAAEAAVFTMDNVAGDAAPLTGRVVPPPRNNALSSSRTILASTFAALALAVQQALELIEPLRTANPLFNQMWVWLALAGIFVTIYARVDDHLKAKNG